MSDAIESFIKANDATQFNEVSNEAAKVRAYEDLVKYLLMVRKKVKEQKVDSELTTPMPRLIDWETLRSSLSRPMSLTCKLLETVYLMKLYTRLRRSSSHTHIQLGQTCEHSCQASPVPSCCGCCPKGSSRTWKEVCFACVDAEEFRLAQICALNAIPQVWFACLSCHGSESLCCR